MKGRKIKTTALIDSGAAGNFMSYNFANSNQFSLIPCDSRLSVEALDGRPLGEGRIRHITTTLQLTTEGQHTESLQFYITSPHNPVVLGMPWLRQHNPTISWKEGRILQWDESCRTKCVTVKSSLSVRAVAVQDKTVITPLPTEYSDLVEAFSQVNASKLPPHRSADCAINLLPGTTPPKGRIFPLSQPESETMENYIKEELAKGFVQPSTSPASAGFFFVKKKDGGLRPCIDYRGLNEITVKFRYPLPLVPPALELLRRARYFSKLDLRSAYNLIRIREGDEWKTAFSTSTGHYEYLVMPFGLVK